VAGQLLKDLLKAGWLYTAQDARCVFDHELAAWRGLRYLVGRRTLVLSPHPDDEVLGCGRTVARRVAAGAMVWIVHLTNGAAGSGTVAGREEEARAAAATLGLGLDRLMFLRFPDGQLMEHGDAAAERVRRLMSDLEIQDLFCPYRREYHADHMATWRIARTLLRPGMRLYEYPIWYGPWLGLCGGCGAGHAWRLSVNSWRSGGRSASVSQGNWR
jgi:hypothetical protein